MRAPNFYAAVIGIFLSMVAPAQANCPSGSGRFTANEGEVADKITGLIWRRCSAGQIWSMGECVGSAKWYTHEQALAYARDQIGWRLPNVKELSSLVDRGCINPAIDSTIFPGTVFNLYRTSSSAMGGRTTWSVDFAIGYVDGYRVRSEHYGPVRLVRASQ